MLHDTIKVHTHGFSATDPIHGFLQSLLPHGIPLLRRIQHHERSKDAVLLATFPPSNLPEPGESFAILFFEPATAFPLVAGYLFSSLELSTPLARLTGRPDDPTPQDKPLAVRHISALLHQVHQLLSTLPPTAPAGTANPYLFKLGSTHSATRSALLHLGSPAHPVVRDDLSGKAGPYGKYVFRSSSVAPAEAAPPGLRFEQVPPEDFGVVVANNALAYSPKFLSALRSVGLREEATGRLVAWVFMGPDGSVRSVHVEPEWRRRGLARAVVVRLVKEVVKGEEGEVWQHADVADENEGSVRLFEGLGAERVWEAYWTSVDVSRLGDGS